jgi:hypothetical protein
MALFQVSHPNKHGNIRTRILHRPTTQFVVDNPKAYGGFINVQLFKYTYEHPTIPPTLHVSENGKKYILPSNQEVIPETTIKDIEWVKIDPINRVTVYKKPKPIQVPTTWEFESSSSPGQFYTVRLVNKTYKCNCSGFFRAKDKEKGCTHVQKVKNGK